MSEHYMRLKTRYDGVREWSGVSVWDTPNGQLRTEHSRTTFYTDEQQARRWARKYKVEFPEVPEPARRVR